MGELIICALAGVVPSVVFGLLFFFHVRGERSAVTALAEEGFRHIAARGAKDAGEAKGTQLYQQEALREQQIEFDRQERELQDAQPQPTGPQVIKDDRGESWEVLAGMD